MQVAHKGKYKDKYKANRLTLGDRVFDILNIIILGFIALLIFYPLWYVLIASVMDPNIVNSGRILIFPGPGEWFTGGYERIVSYSKVWVGYKNTIIYTVVGTIISLLLTIPTGYVLSRKDMTGQRAITLLFSFTMFFQGGMIPTYLLIKNMGMLDTIWSIVLPGGISVWNLIICRTFFQNNLPNELLEAAHIDGCNDFRFFFQMALPLSSTIIAVMLLFYATAMWNSYFQAMLYLSNADKQPLQIVLRDLILINQVQNMVQDASEVVWRQKLADQLKYAVIIVAALPLLIAYPFVQKYFAKGVMIGAIKG